MSDGFPLRVLTVTPTPTPDFDSLPARVLCIATHAGDGLVGCGGTLARHAKRGDRVRLLALACSAEELAALRTAAGALGVSNVETLEIAQGTLGGMFDLVERLRQELLIDEPELVYAPSPLEGDADRRAASRALTAAATGRRGVRVFFYSSEGNSPANFFVDVTKTRTTKKKALKAGAAVVEEGRAARSLAADLAATLKAGAGASEAAEDFVALEGAALADFMRVTGELTRTLDGRSGTAASSLSPGARATAVISTWNKKDDVRANLEGLRAQTEPFASVVVVDNASSDGTAEMIAAEFPEVRLIVMPHSAYGACETFNIGFASSKTELTAILDDDVVLPPEWLERAMTRLAAEPSTTAVVSTKIVEPGMPESYKNSPEINRERYMSTFRGCASLARTRALEEAGGYDERLFIYGNERDLTCRLLNLGYRVLQYPGAEAFHKTPFGIKMGKRSLFYHARNAWLGMLKYAPLGDLAKMPFLVVSKVLLRTGEKEVAGEVSDATGTIGIGRSVRETPGAWWILTKAAASVLYNVPYCLKRREPVKAPDFELPIQ